MLKDLVCRPFHYVPFYPFLFIFDLVEPATMSSFISHRAAKVFSSASAELHSLLFCSEEADFFCRTLEENEAEPRTVLEMADVL